MLYRLVHRIFKDTLFSEQIQTEHIGSIDRLDSEVQIGSICSVSISSRKRDIVEKRQ